jgi:hypothetical protein
MEIGSAEMIQSKNSNSRRIGVQTGREKAFAVPKTTIHAAVASTVMY